MCARFLRAKYPSMDLAYAAGRIGGSMTGVLSAGNEQAVEVGGCLCMCVRMYVCRLSKQWRWVDACACVRVCRCVG